MRYIISLINNEHTFIIYIVSIAFDATEMRRLNYNLELPCMLVQERRQDKGKLIRFCLCEETKCLAIFSSIHFLQSVFKVSIFYSFFEQVEKNPNCVFVVFQWRHWVIPKGLTSLTIRGRVGLLEWASRPLKLDEFPLAFACSGNGKI